MVSETPARDADLDISPEVAAELAPAAERLAQAQAQVAERAERYVREFDGEESEKRAAKAAHDADRSRRRADDLHRRANGQA